ncbi:MAG: SUMF1/EgtB/PvdO family nonheme iron enzyme, partial [Oceanococcaceae bacterium]
AYALADRPVTQGEWLDFMADGAYENAALWLSDGWAWVQSEGIRAPLYWYQQDGVWWQYTLQGTRPVDPSRPVAHLSFYEAAAYAEWTGARLPTEQEWEALAAERPLVGDFCAASPAEALPLGEGHPGHGSAYFYGGVWEWTRSAYGPYPGFRPPAGALGEYNAKFMASQLVLRGGSCASPPGHLRPSYRNFFYPQQRWQFSGLRLARDD